MAHRKLLLALCVNPRPLEGADMVEKMMESLPNATLEMVVGAGHAPWLDALDHAAASVRAHLQG